MKPDRDRRPSPEPGLDELREHYRRLDGSAPPPDVDEAVLARARAAARRRPRVPGWWVPTALAATVVIAFSLLLRIEQEPVGTALTERAEAPLSRQATQGMQAPDSTHEAVGPDAAAPTVDASAEVEEAPAVPPSAPPPEPAAPVSEAEAPAASSTAHPATRTTAPATEAAPRARIQAADAVLPAPEEWLARIEALEAAGRHDEARSERERLEAAYPGWLAGQARKRD